MNKIRYRQIHLDFHTSPLIPGVGAEFNENEFGKILEDAHVNSITCFSRCHHGYLYYESSHFPERIHPHLQEKNLLYKQIQSAHKHGIRVPIYLPIEWDAYTANEHPEWCIKDIHNAPVQDVFEAGFYNSLCVNTPYLDFLKVQITEVMQMFQPVDGLFLDILNIRDCCCKWCLEEMCKLGINVEDENERWKFAQFKLDRFKDEMTSFIHDIDESCSIFYNVDHVGVKHRNYLHTFSHLEIESLPSGKWGYQHFPITARYARTLGLPLIGMTGKFHTSWGDFHSIKNKEALSFECLYALALNAGCSIGDQLHPDGHLDSSTYDLIGTIYGDIERKEPWCIGAQAVCELAVLASEEFCTVKDVLVREDLIGASKMLSELNMQYDIIDTQANFLLYKIIILTDDIVCNASLQERLKDYIDQGGYVLAAGHGIFSKEHTTLPDFGIEYQEEAPFNTDFISAKSYMKEDLPALEYVMYQGSVRVSQKSGRLLAITDAPYFNRTWEHYCSHMHAPSSHLGSHPAIIEGNHTIYFAHPIFKIYAQTSPKWVKQLLKNALFHILEQPLIIHNGPSTLITTLNIQKEKKRYILHALHYIPQRKGRIDIIEDEIPLHNIQLHIRCPKRIEKVSLVPENIEIPFEMKKDTVIITIDIYGHRMVELSY